VGKGKEEENRGKWAECRKGAYYEKLRRKIALKPI